jgi:hypothetical protein
MCTTKNTLKLIENLHSLLCFWVVLTAEYKNHNKKCNSCDTLAKEYSVSVIQVEKKIQALKMQFQGGHKNWWIPREQSWEQGYFVWV